MVPDALASVVPLGNPVISSQSGPPYVELEVLVNVTVKLKVPVARLSTMPRGYAKRPLAVITSGAPLLSSRLNDPLRPVTVPPTMKAEAAIGRASVAFIAVGPVAAAIACA
jgi:hypothetical protein